MSIQGEQPIPEIEALLGRANELKAAIEEGNLQREGLQEVRNEFKQVREDISALQAKADAEAIQTEQKALLDEMKAMLEQSRTPSKAAVIGSGAQPKPDGEMNFFAALAQARSRDYDVQQVGKARLDEMGSGWAGVDPRSKATVGDTDAAGGYLVPNPVVTDINIQAQPGRTVVDLFTVIDGVRGSQVDVPWEQSAEARAVIALAGATKENTNFIVNNYTATLYTLARIFDVGNQLLRQSEGAAERLVRSKLARAFALGEDFYAIQGTGTNQPYGLLTALGTAGTYFTTFSTPSTSTIAGNFATALAALAGPVANRGAQPDAAVMNSGDYWTLIASGADAAGFYVQPSGGAYAFNAQNVGAIGAGPWGLRLAHTPNMPSDSAVVGEFKAATFFRGQGYRVDVSDQAGTRWDNNVTGFRGEEEIAFDARPYVYTGYFQRTNNILP
jgi:HK97 family phage major capsid protein